MVSVYFFPADLTNSDLERLHPPRLSKVTEEELADIRTYLAQTKKGQREQDTAGVYRKDIADLIVDCYADMIEYMATKIKFTEVLVAEIDFFLGVFIEYPEIDGLSGAIDSF